MTTVNWVSKTGDWTTGANWSTGASPASTDDAMITNGGAVIVTTSIAVNSNYGQRYYAI